jgi:hypothetical protein
MAPYRYLLASGPVSRSWCYYARFILFKGLKILIVCPQATGFEHVGVQGSERGLCFNNIKMRSSNSYKSTIVLFIHYWFIYLLLVYLFIYYWFI